MGWTIFLFVLAFLLYVVADWFFIPIVLMGWGIWLIFRHEQASPTFQVTENSDEFTESRTQTQITGVTLLHLALTHQYQLGKLTTFRFQHLSQQVDKLYADVCGQLEISDSEQRSLLESTWFQLDKSMEGTLGEIPWYLKAFRLSDLEAAPVPSPSTDDTPWLKKDFELPDIQTASVPSTQVSADDSAPNLQGLPNLEGFKSAQNLESLPNISAPNLQGLPNLEGFKSAQNLESLPNISAPNLQGLPNLEGFKSAPNLESLPNLEGSKSAPNLESLPNLEGSKSAPNLQGLPNLEGFKHVFTQIFVQFLWQNIGWFIAGFCLVSGSIFFVVSTTGFSNALAVFIIFYLYAFILFWGGYQIRHRYPKLETSSHVLLTIGVLLVPLTFTAAVRLIESSMPDAWLVGIAGLLSVFAIGGFAIALKLASGMIERTLQNEHSYLFIGLAALQFAQPLLKLAPDWWWLAALHVSLLGILGYALLRFAQHWLHSIFIEQRKIAYYAAGTLVYAATVSFVALTWGSKITLPKEYAGFFLMACSLLLLYVDTQFKQWVHKQALLSHFTFVIYALSVLAILLSLSGETFPPAALSLLTLTLGLGAVLYGRMMWDYLTLPPLYLLLVCLSGLYSLLILQHFPYHWYFLLSLPGLVGIMRLYRFAQKRDSTALMKVCYRAMILLSVGLVGWSLYHASPGIVAMLTALIATVGAFWHLKKKSDFDKKSNLFQSEKSEIEKKSDLFNGYAVILLATITLAYTPLFLGVSWVYQFGGGLVILAVLWAALGLWKYSENSLVLKTLIQTTLFNGALLSLAASVILIAIIDIPLYQLEIGGDFFIGLLFVVSGILLWLSLSLRVRTLFYVMLVFLAAGGLLLKFQYFPTSSGRGVILLALATGLLLWWLHYRFIYLPVKTSTPQSAFSLFWWFDYRLVHESGKLHPPRQQLKQLSESSSTLKGTTQDTKSKTQIPHSQFPNFTLLWFLQVWQETYSSRFDLVKAPLQHAMLLLWLVGLWRLCTPLFELWLTGGSVLDLKSAYAISIFLGILVTGLLAAQIRRLALLPLAVFLAMWALFVISPISDAIWLPLLSAAYALLIWLVTLLLLKLLQPSVAFFLGWQGSYDTKGGRFQAETMVHWTVFVICLLSAGIALFQFDDRVVLYATLGFVSLFFMLAGLRYRLQLHSYFVIGGIGLGGFILYGSAIGLPILFLLEAESITLLLTLVVIGIALLAQTFVAYSTWQRFYKQPLFNTAGLIYIWALFNSLFLFFNSLPAWLPLVFILLAVGLLPLLRGFVTDEKVGTDTIAESDSIGKHAGTDTIPERDSIGKHAGIGKNAGTDTIAERDSIGKHAGIGKNTSTDTIAESDSIGKHAGTDTIAFSDSIGKSIRGIGVALLLSMAFVSVFGGQALQSGDLASFVPWAWVFWGYVLWGVSHFGLPRWNARWTQWTIAPDFWLILGFIFVGCGFGMDVALLESVRWQILLLVTLYLFLLFRDVDWKGLPWLAVLALIGSGLSVLINLLPWENEYANLPFFIGMALWAHVLLRLRDFLPSLKPPFHLSPFTFHLQPLSGKINQLDNPLLVLPLMLLGGGLLLILSLLTQSQQYIPDWTVLLTITFYLFLIFRHVDWAWLPWLAVLGLMGSGASVLVTLFLRTAAEEWVLYGAVFWATLFLFLSSRLQRLAVKRMLSLSGIVSVTSNFFAAWKIKQLAQPLFVWAIVVLGCELLFLSVVTSFALMQDDIFEPIKVFIFLAILLNLSFLYVVSFRPQPWLAHILLLSLLNTVLLLFSGWLNLPLLLSLWTTGLLLAFYAGVALNSTPITGAGIDALAGDGAPLKGETKPTDTGAGKVREAMISVMRYWLTFSFGAALVSLIVMSEIAIGERLLTQALLAGLSFGIGLQNAQRKKAHWWLNTSALLLLVLSHLIWLVWIPVTQLILVLPWYALQDALLAWGLFWLIKAAKPSFLTKLGFFHHALPFVPYAFLLTMLAALAWLGHSMIFFASGAAPLFGSLDNIAALLAGLLLINFWWRESHIANKSLLIYGLAFMVALLSIYLRLVWFGLAPINVWDTAALMGASYLLFTIHHFVPTPPIYRLTLLMPMLAIFTIPLQLSSDYASSTLLVAATLYLLMQRRSEHYLPMYLGLLAINISLYLWIPEWANNYKLVQLYTMPVAITVLLMLQLHRQELKPRVLNAIRLVALSALYASATLDVFMRPDLSIFILALGLSLGGILLGIALRIRAFLYIGTLFLIFNVLGQLIEFYPEDRLGKAIILTVLGSLIAGGMIWFDIQREALMQRILIMRADLARWE